MQLLNGVAKVGLTNPLLKKYDFNAEDFLLGAEQALQEVTRLVSRDLFEYATNINVKKSERLICPRCSSLSVSQRHELTEGQQIQ